MPTRIVNLPFASGNTGATNTAVYVGSHDRLAFVVSNVTAFNAAAGNTTIKLYSSANYVFSTTVGTATFYPIQSMSIATEVSGGVYPLPYNAGPWVKVGFGTAPTGSAANANIDLIVQATTNT